MIRTLVLAACLPAMAAACAPSPLEPTVMNSRPTAAGPHAAPVPGDTARPGAAAVAPPYVDLNTAKEPARPLPEVVDFNRGRQLFSTAFVLMGPDRRLTVELRDRRVLVLENPLANPGDFCGAVVAGPGLARGSKFCAGYAEVVAARPGALGGALSEGPRGPSDNPVETL